MSDAIRRPCLMHLLVACWVGAGACGRYSEMMPGTYASAVSPDSLHRAMVRRAPSLDPPNDSLHLASRGRPERLLMGLAPDADWCRSIIWSPDSRTVGFVIADDRLAVFDVDTGTLQAFFFLAGTGCCGGPEESRHVTFNADATQVSYERVRRPRVRIRASSGAEFEAAVTGYMPGYLESRWPLVAPATSVGREIASVPTARRRLHLRAGARNLAGVDVSVRIGFDDRRSIDVAARSSPDGVVVLPAVGDRVSQLEVGIAGLGSRRIIVKDVQDPPAASIVNVSM